MNDRPNQTTPQYPDYGSIDGQSINGGAVQPTGIPGKTDTAADGGEPRSITNRERLQAILDPPMAHWLSNSGADDETITSMYDQLEHLFASRLSALLSGLGGDTRKVPVYPETMEYVRMVKSAHDNGKYDDMYENGWKACDDQWRALLAKRKAEL